MRVGIAADLQIGSGQTLVANRLDDQARMWREIVARCRLEDVDALLVLGDVFNKYPPSPDELCAFKDPLWDDFQPWDVICILGNHDYGGVNRKTGLHVLQMGGLVIGERPGWMKVGDGSVAWLPWTPISHLAVNGGSRGDLNQEAAELLLETARGLYAEMPAGPKLLVGHWAISGCVGEEFLREPIIQRDELDAIGFDAMRFGHIHARDEYYVGSPWVNAWGEDGEEHGWEILEIDRKSQLGIEFIPTADRQFVTVDPSGPIVGVEQGAVARVVGEHSEASAEVIAHLASSGVDVIDKTTIAREDRSRVAGLDEGSGVMEALELWIESQGIEPELAEGMRQRTAHHLQEGT